MALILDKTTTGVTLTDVSGNTLETGYTHLNYEDEHGITHENPYLVIDYLIINKLTKFVKLVINIYKDQQSRLDGKKPFSEKTYLIDITYSNLYDKYFSINNMENKNIFESAYNFISKEYYNGWKSDEV